VQEQIEISVQVNGKMRARVGVAAGADEATVRDIVLADERVRKFVGATTPRKLIYVPGKLVNIVV
jgi:leucyl-tRNA synthetase